MSLAIDIDEVSEVLLADGWHAVLDESFYVDAYEILGDTRPSKMRVDYSHGAGFAFKETLPKSGEVVWTKGPMESVIAMRTGIKKK